MHAVAVYTVSFDCHVTRNNNNKNIGHSEQGIWAGCSPRLPTGGGSVARARPRLVVLLLTLRISRPPFNPQSGCDTPPRMRKESGLAATAAVTPRPSMHHRCDHQSSRRTPLPEAPRRKGRWVTRWPRWSVWWGAGAVSVVNGSNECSITRWFRQMPQCSSCE